MIKEKYNLFIKDNKKQIRQLILLHKYEEALSKIANMANMLYESNQYYVDNDSENALLNIQRQLQKKYDFEEIKDVNTKTVLFYDGFGLDSRGLAYIYLKALVNLGYKVIYMTISNAQGNIPRITKLIEDAGGEIVFCRTDSYIFWYQYMYKVFSIVKPAKAFFYTTPYDVSAVMAFNQLAGQVERYQINLTDHAFWLGINAFDYCLEFRDYGANISLKHRLIARNKILKQPYYPDINKNMKFQGFPFEKKQDDFVVFSGGFLYKTIDDELIYYKLVEYLLLRYPQLKLWYAGYGSNEQFKPLRELMTQYPNRVFYTAERKDLFQVLENVDMYLNTYPIAGGLLTQYSALAGKPPFTLSNGEDSCAELLFDGAYLGVETSDIDELMSYIDVYINSKSSNVEYREKMQNSVISEEAFADNLQNILVNRKSEYGYSIHDISSYRLKEQNDFWHRFEKKFSR